MKEILCEDCGFYTTNHTKNGTICRMCEAKKSNDKTRGVKYKPVKESVMYRKAINARLKTDFYRPSQTVINFLSNNTEYQKQENNQKTNEYNEYIETVTKDVRTAFEDYNLSDSYLKIDLLDFINILYSLVQEDNYISDVEKAERIFNKISVDYLHLMEKAEWGSEDAVKYANYQKALLELRRPTKNMLSQYEIIKPFILYLQDNEDLMNALEKVRQELIDRTGRNMDYKLKQTSLKNDLGLKPRYKKYEWEVMCYGLYGNRGQSPLKSLKPTYARNEEDAIENICSFIDQSFKGVVYRKQDIVLSEITE